MAIQLASDFFGSGGGAVGIYPLFPPKRALNSRSLGRPEGFLGNGDYFSLPNALGTSTLEYRDVNASLIWSINPTDINAACTDWNSFCLDAVDNLLWVTAINNTANATIYLANINAAGTLTVVGSTATTIGLNAGRWIGSTSNRAGASLTRETPGVGNFIVRTSQRELVLDYTNGSLVSEVTNTSLLQGAFKSTSGVYFSPQSLVSLSAASNIQGVYQNLALIVPTEFSTVYSQTRFKAPPTLGLPSNVNTNGVDTYTHLQWKGDVLLVNPGTTIEAFCLFDYGEYLQAVDSFIRNVRANQ